LATSQITEITIPVYWTQKYKTKKDKTMLAGMNAYRNLFYHAKNQMKKDLEEHVKIGVYKEKMLPIKGEYKVEYYYHYKNSISDLLNVGALSSKVLLDALQDLGLVENDNVKYCKEEHFYVGEKNINNPHMQIRIEAIDQTSQKTESTKG
jgi:hypothetical protein